VYLLCSHFGSCKVGLINWILHHARYVQYYNHVGCSVSSVSNRPSSQKNNLTTNTGMNTASTHLPLFDSPCIERICLTVVNNTSRACHFISLIWSLPLLLFTSATGWLLVRPNGHRTEVVEKLVAGMAASEPLVCCICASRFVALCINDTPWWRRIGVFQGYKFSYSADSGCLYRGLVFSRRHFRISNTPP
jgi:hypothetical protein